MRTGATLKSIPVIIYTADTHSLRKVHHKLAVHDHDILEKPFDLNVLLELVARMIAPKQQELDGSPE